MKIVALLMFLFIVYQQICIVDYAVNYKKLSDENRSMDRINNKLSSYLGDCMRQYKEKTNLEYEQEVDGGWFNDELQVK